MRWPALLSAVRSLSVLFLSPCKPMTLRFTLVWFIFIPPLYFLGSTRCLGSLNFASQCRSLSIAFRLQCWSFSHLHELTPTDDANRRRRKIEILLKKYCYSALLVTSELVCRLPPLHLSGAVFFPESLRQSLGPEFRASD